MKKILAVLTALGLLLALAGCGKEIAATITEPMLGPDGKALTDANGTVLTRTKSLPPEYGYYEAQKEANQPVVSLKIPAGGQGASLPAGTELSFRLPTPVKQYTPESVQLLQEAKSWAPWAFAWRASDNMKELGQSGIAGARSTTNTVNNTGDGNAINTAGGALSGATTVSPTTTITTTTTTGAETPTSGVSQ